MDDNCGDRPSRTHHLKVSVVMIFSAVVLAGVYLASTHINDEIWYDEAYTLLNFSSRGFVFPFTDYHVPNNHILFSALLAEWWTPGCSTAYLRLLPLLLYCGSLALFSYATVRMGGWLAGLCALVMFATSPVTLNFVLQLRGYSASWMPMIGSFLALPLYAKGGRWYWGGTYLLSSMVSIAILPTNLMLYSVLVVWGALQIGLDRQQGMKQRAGRIVLISVGPLLGLLAYSNVLYQLYQKTQRKISGWNYSDLVQHWLLSTYADYLLLLPFIGLGLVALLPAVKKNTDLSVGSPGSNLSLIAALLIVQPLWALLIPNSSFPRNFVPLLPVWYYIGGYLFASGWCLLFAQKRYMFMIFMAIVVVSVPVRTTLPYGAHVVSAVGAFPQNLLRQYYHDRFYPSRVLQILDAVTGDAATVVMVDSDSLSCLGYLVRNESKTNIRLAHYKYVKALRQQHALKPHFVVTRDTQELKRMLTYAGLSDESYREIQNTGYFKIYARHVK